MKKILYLDNFNNYDLFKEIESEGMQIDYLLFNRSKVENARKKNLSFIEITFRSDFFYKKSVSYDFGVKDVEKIIDNDRLLRYLPTWVSKRLLINYLLQIEMAIDKGNYDLVVGEISWAIEYFTYILCERKGIKYRHILNLPLSEVRIVGFDAEHSFQSLSENIGILSENYYSISYKRLCEGVKLANEKGKIDTVYSSDRSSDYREFKLLWLISASITKVNSFLFRALYRKFSVKLNSLTAIENKSQNIIYFPLHVQPESTPDYVSPTYSDQFELLLQISNMIDKNDTILVKEHPNKVSPRNILKFLRLIKRGNVKFICIHEPGTKLIEYADVTFTVAGTSCLESLEFNKPSIIFSNIFYSRQDGVFDGRESLNNGTISTLIKKVKNLPVSACKTQYQKFGLRGFVHDPKIFENVLERKNIKALESLLLHLSGN